MVLLISINQMESIMCEENLIEKSVASKSVYEGFILHVKEDDIELPNGKPAKRELIRHIGAVCVVPVTDNNEIIVERQFRYPINQVITEIPAGKLDSMDEDRLEAAKRELKEETGYEADEWTDIGLYYPAAAYSDEKITMYMAKGLHKGEQKLDEDEFLDVKLIPVDTLVDMIMKGEITDGKTQVAVLKVANLLK